MRRSQQVVLISEICTVQSYAATFRILPGLSERVRNSRGYLVPNTMHTYEPFVSSDNNHSTLSTNLLHTPRVADKLPRLSRSLATPIYWVSCLTGPTMVRYLIETRVETRGSTISQLKQPPGLTLISRSIIIVRKK